MVGAASRAGNGSTFGVTIPTAGFTAGLSVAFAAAFPAAPAGATDGARIGIVLIGSSSMTIAPFIGRFA